METPHCPDCGREIPKADANPETDRALCRGCGGLWTYEAAIAAVPGRRAWEAMTPPKGCSVRQGAEGPTVVVSTRSVRLAILGLIPTMVWNGVIFGLFVPGFGSMVWSSFATTQPGSGAFWGLVGLTVFLAAFFTPFVLAGLYLAWMTLMAAFGRWEIDRHDEAVRVRAIAGPVVRTWIRQRSEVTGVALSKRRRGRGGGTSLVVELAGARPVTIEVEHSWPLKSWVAGAIEHLVLAKRSPAGEAELVKARCPACGTAVRAADVNVAADEARCAVCGARTGLVALVRGEEELPTKPSGETPKGCRIDGNGEVVTVTASMASFKMFLGALLVNGFWNGIVSVFAGTGFGALYRHLVGPLPWWYPWANTVVSQNHGPQYTANTMPLSDAIELCVFSIPFLLIGSLFFTVLVLSVIGRVRVTLTGQEGVAFRGILLFGRGLGFRRRFDASAVQAVKVAGSQSGGVILVEKGDIKFGGLLPRPRAFWMAGVLRQFLLPPPTSPTTPTTPRP